jgi:hypothetical protein
MVLRVGVRFEWSKRQRSIGATIDIITRSQNSSSAKAVVPIKYSIFKDF